MLVLIGMWFIISKTAFAQNVGIGTSNPGQKLDVAGWLRLGDESASGTNTEGSIRYHSGKKLQFYDGTQWIDILSSSAGDHDWYEIGTTLPPNSITDGIYRTGNVGIGTTAPAARLHTAISGAGTHIILERTTTFPSACTISNSGNLITHDYNGTGIVLSISGAEKIRAHAAGALITGTTNSTGNYQLDGTNVIFNNKNDVYGNIRVLQNNSPTLADGMYINYNSSGGNAADVRFYANGVTERMRIVAASGHVGINTPTPSYLLHVNGTAGVGQTYLLNSDIYFTKTDHNHTGIGNSDGYAAIENADNFNTLLVLGRDVLAGAGLDRRVSVYDKLSIAGNTFHTGAALSVNGSVRVKGGGANGNDSNRGFAFEDDGDTGLFAVGGSSPTFERLSLYLNNSERITIRGGFVGINNNNPAYDLHLANNSAAKPSSSTWTVSSDARLKSLDGPYSKGLNEILQLKPVLYHYIADTILNLPNEEQCIGLIAQEVQKVFPEAVKTGAAGYLDLDIHPLLIAYINAFKEQQVMIEKLERAILIRDTEMAELKNRISELLETRSKVSANPED
ncbi:MAG: hypothetical protein KatS3mg031_3013 [Chitinophagales bacterium]|nr:MAG: hypothetical protein KatS3mg031_3013 [Chitinophagales bacterium]